MNSGARIDGGPGSTRRRWLRRLLSVFVPADRYQFLIYAPPYTHASSGIRALYRLCHHLNAAGHPAAMVARRAAALPPWHIPFHHGRAGRSIVIYPEIVSGNPYGARKIIRWALHAPGRLGGDRRFDDDEMVFVYDAQMLPRVAAATAEPLGSSRVLWFGLIDPAFIYPGPAGDRTLELSFTHKGRDLAARFPLPAGIGRLEDHTPDMAALGDVLRRTRTLYSYDHYSNVLREAVLCGAQVRTIDERGVWHDPRTCACPGNIAWKPGFEQSYAAEFDDQDFVAGFVDEVRTRWPVPAGPAVSRVRLRR